MYSTPEDFIMEADDTIDALTIKEDDRKVTKIPPAGVGLLKTFKQFVSHQQLQGVPFGYNDWTSITHDQFNAFQISNTNNPMPMATSSVPPPVTSSKTATTNLVHNTFDKASCVT